MVLKKVENSKKCHFCVNWTNHLSKACSKNLLNGPCGGAQEGKCEIDKELDCAWQLIYDRMKLLYRLEELEEIQPIKDRSNSRDSGPRKVIRDDLTLK